MAHWKRIFYSSIRAIGNSSFPLLLNSLGTPNGPGFDWKDLDSFAFGAEWRATADLTLRSGYFYNANPVRSRAVVSNIVSPVIDVHHVSGGLNYKVTKNSSIDFAAVYTFKNSMTSLEPLPQTLATPFGGVNPAAEVTIWLRGIHLSVGWTYKFDAGDTSYFPTHL
jgi:long-chain fatty acid transport protein